MILLACTCLASVHAQHEVVISFGTTFSSMKGDDYGSASDYYYEPIKLIDFGYTYDWTYNGSYSRGVGTSFAIEYAYYLTPYWKPYFRINSATQNVTYERAFQIGDGNDNAYDTFDFSILTRDIGFGLYREWNNGLSVGLGLNQVTGNQIDVEERYLDILEVGNAEFADSSVDFPYGSFWKMEWSVKYQMGKFGIELRRRGLSDYSLTSEIQERTNTQRGMASYDFGRSTKIRSTSILLNYSIFINK
mgnify:FL=1